MTTIRRGGGTHPQRKEIARYLLSRGLDAIDQVPDPARMAELAAPLEAPLARALAAGPAFPTGLAPTPAPITPAPSQNDPLPHADVVVITWTVDELVGLAHVLTPGVAPARWHRYAHKFADYAPAIRPHAPAANSGRLGSYMPTRVGSAEVLCMKSELHLNQDGVKTGDRHGHAAGQGLLQAGHRRDRRAPRPDRRHRGERLRRLRPRRRRRHPRREVPAAERVPQRALQRRRLPERLDVPDDPPRHRRRALMQGSRERARRAPVRSAAPRLRLRGPAPDDPRGQRPGHQARARRPRHARVPPDPHHRLLRVRHHHQPPRQARAPRSRWATPRSAWPARSCRPAALGRRAQHVRPGHQRRPAGQAVPPQRADHLGGRLLHGVRRTGRARSARSPPGVSSPV